MGRAPCCEKVGLKRGRWTADEDEKLINYIKQNGEGSWRSLPKNAGLLRCGKSCRLRWINYLRTDLKRGNFTREEEETIINLHRSVGNKWSLIASNLPGRTDNEVKNYWNSHLSRKIYSFRSSNGSLVTATTDMVKMQANKCNRKGGRVSRAVAKKYNMHTNIIPKPKSSRKMVGITSGIQDATTAAVEAQVCNRSNVVSLVEQESGKDATLLKPLEDKCVNDENSLGGTLMPSPNKLEGEKELIVGQTDGLDDLTSSFLQSIMDSELMMELSDISMHTGETENDLMLPENGSINKDSDSGASICNSHSDTRKDGLYDCFSPLNSCFNHELVTWDDAEYAVPGFGFWDQEDHNNILWPWDEKSRTLETEL